MTKEFVLLCQCNRCGRQFNSEIKYCPGCGSMSFKETSFEVPTGYLGFIEGLHND